MRPVLKTADIPETSPDEYELESSGRSVFAHQYVIGINPNLEVYQGYSSLITWNKAQERFSKEEIVELADYMIDLWTKFKKMGE